MLTGSDSEILGATSRFGFPRGALGVTATVDIGRERTSTFLRRSLQSSRAAFGQLRSLRSAGRAHCPFRSVYRGPTERRLVANSVVPEKPVAGRRFVFAGILCWLLMCYLARLWLCQAAAKCLKLWWVCKDLNLGPGD
jgi:hypothetical protein